MSVIKQGLMKSRWRLLCFLLSLILYLPMVQASHSELLLAAGDGSGKLSPHATGVDDRESYHFGVPPIMSPLQLEQAYGPSVLSLRESLDRPVVFRTKLSLTEFEQAVAAEEYDILFVHPIIFVEMAQAAHYIAVARRRAELRAIVVSGKESPLESMNDLRNMTIGWLPELAITTRLTIQHLKKLGITLNELNSQVFLNHHDCLLALMQGKIDACVTTAHSLDSFNQQLNVEFKVISETSAVPHKMVAVHQRVSAEHRQLITEAVLGWGSTQESRALLESMGAKLVVGETAFIPVSPDFLTDARILMQEMNE